MAEPLRRDLRFRSFRRSKEGCRAVRRRRFSRRGFERHSLGCAGRRPLAICGRSRWAEIGARRRSRLRPTRSCRFWPKSRIRRWPSFRKRWRQRDIASACRRSGAFSIGASSRLKKRMARPVCKGFFRDGRLISLRQRIRPRSLTPAKMEIRAFRSNKTRGVERRFLNQASGAPFDCQAISLSPSQTPKPIDAFDCGPPIETLTPL